jgi:hypothetical protein
VSLSSNVFTVVMSFALFSTSGDHQTRDNQWKNLLQANHGRTYTFVTRELRCADGRITAATDQRVSLKRSQGGTVSIARRDLLRFASQRTTNSAGVFYSGRSSWLDVKDLPRSSRGGVELQVVLLDGTERHGNFVDLQDTTITLRDAGRNFQLAKSDIAQVYRVADKILSERAEYAYEELFVFKIFDPELWPYFFDKGRFSVRLYDSQMKEDSSVFECKQEL